MSPNSAMILTSAQELNTPLLAAARWGRIQCLQVLVKAGANLKAMNRAHFTALHKAAAHGHPECVRFLIAAGADTEAPTRVRFKRVLLALLIAFPKSCHSLIADRSHTLCLPGLQRLWTPLQYACDLNRLECVRALLEGGASLESVNMVRRFAIAPHARRAWYHR